MDKQELIDIISAATSKANGKLDDAVRKTGNDGLATIIARLTISIMGNSIIEELHNRINEEKQNQDIISCGQSWNDPWLGRT